MPKDNRIELCGGACCKLPRSMQNNEWKNWASNIANMGLHFQITEITEDELPPLPLNWFQRIVRAIGVKFGLIVSFIGWKRENKI